MVEQSPNNTEVKCYSKDKFPSSILSSLYPVFLSVTIAAIIDTTGTHLSLKFPEALNPIEQWALAFYFTIFLYYLLDWLISIYRSNNLPSKYSHGLLLILIIANMAYCGLIINFSINPHASLTILGLYYFVSGLYDAVVWSGTDQIKFLNIAAVIRMLAGLILAVLTYVDKAYINSTEIIQWGVFLAAVVTLCKGLKAYNIVKIKE